MSNRLEELHAQYKRYYLKKYLKAAGVLAAVLVLVYAGYFFIQTQEDSAISTAPVSNSSIKTVVQAKKTQDTPNRPSYTPDVSADELDTAMKNIKDRREKVKKTQPQPKEVKVSKNVFDEPIVEKEVKSNLFSGTQEERSLESWIDKYNQKKSYAVAIYIAKQYYFDKDFKQSGIWAKRANQLDRNKEEAWLYYAKSVYALGNTPKAKRILNIYLQYKKSVKAELLLSEWSQ